MADNQLGVTPADLDPDAVHNLLSMEAQGQIPETIKPHIEKARAAGILPPPLLGPTNPTGFNNKPGAIPQPQMSTKDKFLAAIPDAMEWAKSTGKSMLNSVLDPPTAGMILGGTAGGFVGQPVAGAMIGGAVGAGGKDIYENTDALLHGQQIPHPPLSTGLDIAGGAITGAASEGAGKLLGASIRQPVTPAGKAVEGFFGRKNTMAQQMVDSPVLDFMANVAKYGPGGRSTMEDFESKQSQHVLDHMVSGPNSTAHFMSPTNTTTVDPLSGDLDLGAAGQRYQQDVSSQLGQLPKTSGFDTFFTAHGKDQWQVPNAAGTGNIPIGPTVKEAHDARSAALAQGRRFGKGTPERQAATLEASRNKAMVERALPDQASRDEYNTLLDKYQVEKQRIDNPTVKAMRTGPSNDVIDNIIDGKFKNTENLKTGTGLTTDQMLGRVQNAASPDAWKQLQADTIHRLTERSMKDDLVDPTAMQKTLDSMDEPTKRRLFGPALSDINATLSVLQQANKYKESEAGRLFIAIRTGQAGIKVAGAAAGAVAAGATLGSYAGGKEGHPITGGLAGAATVLVSPYAFSKLLTSEVGRALLTKAAKGGSNTAMQQTKRALTRWVTANVAETGREAVQGGDESSQQEDTKIPEPPK